MLLCQYPPLLYMRFRTLLTLAGPIIYGLIIYARLTAISSHFGFDIILVYTHTPGMASTNWRTQRTQRTQQTLTKNLNYTSLGRVHWVRLVRHACSEPSEPSQPYLKIFDFHNFEYKSLKNHILKILELVHLHT